MQIPAIYQILTRTDNIGLSEYTIPRHYEGINLIDIKKNVISKPKHKKTFFNDLQKNSKQIPASNAYFQNPELKEIKSKKIDFEAQIKKGSKNFIDQIVKKKKGIPAVGQYDIEIDNHQQLKHKYEIINDKLKKKVDNFRQIQIGMQLDTDRLEVGPGVYNVSRNLQLGSTSPKYTIPLTKRKETKSLDKLPNVFTYHPITDQDTFAKIAKKKRNKKSCTFGIGKKNSMPNLKLDIPGPKYSLIQQWGSIKGTKRQKHGQNILQFVSKSQHKSIYRS